MGIAKEIVSGIVVLVMAYLLLNKKNDTASVIKATTSGVSELVKTLQGN
jgi:hypothetical protein